MRNAPFASARFKEFALSVPYKESKAAMRLTASQSSMISIVVHNLADVNHEVLVGLVGPAPLMDNAMMRVLTTFPCPIADWADGEDIPLVDGLIYRPLWIELRRAAIESI